MHARRVRPHDPERSCRLIASGTVAGGSTRFVGTLKGGMSGRACRLIASGTVAGGSTRFVGTLKGGMSGRAKVSRWACHCHP